MGADRRTPRMTFFSIRPRIAVPSVESAVNTVRARGLRVSAARRLLIEGLFAASGPVTAEELAGGLGGWLPRSDLASACRNLETLERIGLVCHVHLGHGPARYALATAAEHEYVACEVCGGFQAVAPSLLDPVRAAVRAATGHEARFDHFPIVGRCQACAER